MPCSMHGPRVGRAAAPYTEVEVGEYTGCVCGSKCERCGDPLVVGVPHACLAAPDAIQHRCPDVTLALRDLTEAVRELKAAVEAKP